MNTIVTNLMKKYSEIQNVKGLPAWAYQLPAPIPFVGKNFGHNIPKTLVYASAENLTYLRNDPDASLHQFSEDEARNRHRIFSTKYPNEKFPYIHLQPINNGSLLTTARILHHLMDISSAPFLPHEFIETISCANVGKFSINERINVDYASSPDYLKESLEYLFADLEELKPEIILLPKSMFRSVNKVMKWEKILMQIGIEHSVDFILVPQITPTVINCHLKKKVDDEYPLTQLLPEELKTMISLVQQYERKINMPVYAEWICKYYKDVAKTITAC